MDLMLIASQSKMADKDTYTSTWRLEGSPED